ncbi:MAG: Hsp70 family protein, partial [Bacteroidota bacterium]
IERMKKEAELNADSDRKARESADLVNQADQLIFQVEKQLKEFGDKLPADKKAQVESGLADLKKAHAEKDLDAIKSTMDALNATFQAASQDMYNQSQSGGGNTNTGNGTDSEVTDVDFEEVKDDKK